MDSQDPLTYHHRVRKRYISTDNGGFVVEEEFQCPDYETLESQEASYILPEDNSQSQDSDIQSSSDELEPECPQPKRVRSMESYTEGSEVLDYWEVPPTKYGSYSRKQINMEQEELFLAFIKRHPQMVRKGIVKRNKDEIARLWGVLAYNLNKIGPPIRGSTAWKKTFSDRRTQLRRKLKLINSGDKNVSLTKKEKLIADLCGLYEETEENNETSTVVDSIADEESIWEENNIKDNASQKLEQNESHLLHTIHSSESETEQGEELQETALSSNKPTRKTITNQLQYDLKKFMKNETNSYAAISTTLKKLHNTMEGNKETFNKLETHTNGILDAFKSMSEHLKEHNSLLHKQTEEMTKQRIESERHHRVMERLISEKIMLKKKALEAQNVKGNT
ncbi:uncharacterized protein LOC106082925 isoform X1 [Stomoxys calcitrans]|uniref:uncharacterized protein LOC106082925 isoform X1 n=1 Tax=Stomoxys calcitrans TaxID=35570 RepID=UPI0027E28317|nr:uncharacterized protein LOC106082925 isoform X1 [Stomoxys calcitrans]XP_013101138.2 uncharacterized protein LOC106082925 isoform X1 [Stomoxys calcitrans]